MKIAFKVLRGLALLPRATVNPAFEKFQLRALRRVGDGFVEVGDQARGDAGRGVRQGFLIPALRQVPFFRQHMVEAEVHFGEGWPVWRPSGYVQAVPGPGYGLPHHAVAVVRPSQLDIGFQVSGLRFQQVAVEVDGFVVAPFAIAGFGQRLGDARVVRMALAEPAENFPGEAGMAEPEVDGGGTHLHLKVPRVEPGEMLEVQQGAIGTSVFHEQVDQRLVGRDEAAVEGGDLQPCVGRLFRLVRLAISQAEVVKRRHMVGPGFQCRPIVADGRVRTL